MTEFFKKRYWLFLLLVVAIAYGQLLGMLPWQDDNTLFFKLAHIKQAAGYFGNGPLGQGAYKYIATPYIPIYYLFGHQSIFYFLYAIFFYFLATLTVYKTFSIVLGEKGGKIAGFLFAAGYVASDGFIRLFNTVSTSISVILISLLLLFYWRFFESHAKKLKWYLLAVLIYWAVVEVARIRTHYLISAVFAFEIIFFALVKPVKNLFKSAARLIPFAAIFYFYFLKSADSRSAAVGNYVAGLVHGDFSKLYGFLSGWINLVIPDWLLKIALNQFRLTYLYLASVVVATVIAYFILKVSKRRNLVAFGFFLTSIFWVLTSKKVFATPVLNLAPADFFPVFLGGEILLLLLLTFFCLAKKKRPLFAFLVLWISAAIGSYAVYDPSLTFTTYHRYLIHAFFAMVGLYAFLGARNKKLALLVVFWGVLNLGRAVDYQYKIVVGRTQPVRKFYDQLTSTLPKIEKGDILYIDVADNMRGVFANAFSVASMPEETAIAWRYGIDRYDFRLVNDYETLLKLVSNGEFGDVNDNPIKVNNIYTFFLADGKLIQTTDEFKKMAGEKGSPQQLTFSEEHLENSTTIEFSLNPSTLVPREFTLRIKATPQYAVSKTLADNKVATNSALRRLAFDYLKYKEEFRKKARVTTTNYWRENVASNLVDGNKDTVWQAHRVSWEDDGPEGGAAVMVDLGSVQEINRLVWQNTYANNSPTLYRVSTSFDNMEWTQASEVINSRRLGSDELQVVKFDSQKARYIRFEVIETLNNDTAGISEIWVVPTKFSDLDLAASEQFLASPFGYITSTTDFYQTLSALSYAGEMQVYWETDKKAELITADDKKLKIIYDTVAREYKISLPAGGTKLKRLKLVGIQVPGELNVMSILVR